MSFTSKVPKFSKESARKLMKVVRLLEKTKPERFYYRKWVGDDWKGRPSLSCGTTACALGWATTLPELRKKGLRLRKDGNYAAHFVTLKQWGDSDESRFDEKDEDISMMAASKVFGISPQQARYCFLNPGLMHENSAHDPKRVANHIRAFVDKELNKLARKSPDTL